MPPFSRALLRLVVAAGVVSTLLVGAGPPRPAAAYPAANVELVGHGWGHGRGMGQFGALGYAVDHGWGWEQILQHYYSNTTMGSLVGGDNAAMSVRILNRDGRDTIVAGSVLVQGDAAGPQSGVLVRRTGPGVFEIWFGGGCGGPWTFYKSVAASRVDLLPAPGTMLGICKSTGEMTVKGTVGAVDAGSSQATVNDLPTGDYLKGVLPFEVSSSWGTMGSGRGMNALRAQAVAARSYAWSTDRPGPGMTCDTTACQVYGGYFANAPNTDAAVDQTAGNVRMLNGVVARTEFSSSTGGYTTGGTFPAVIDAGDSISINPNRTWTASIPVSTIEAKHGLGSLHSVEVVSRNGLGDMGGRITHLRLHFSGGTKDFTSGDAIRGALGSTKSDWFQVVNNPTFPYHVLTQSGSIYSFGGAPYYGSTTDLGLTINARYIADAPGGYWVLGVDGGVFTFGAARFHGSMGGKHLNKPVVGMTALPDGSGYWLVASDGGIFSFGNAQFHGSMGGRHLNQPIVGMAAAPDGAGYWLVASDGGIFAFGSAESRFYGSMGGHHLNQPIVNMVARSDGGGYWLVARDGGLFSFNVPFHGSLPGRGVRETAVDMVASPDDGGYLIATAQGFVHSFGNAGTGGGPANHGSRSATVSISRVR